MDVFALRNDLIADYAQYIQGFIRVQDPRIRETIDWEIRDGLLWPEPLAQISPSFEPGGWIDDLVGAGLLHGECRGVFRARKGEPGGDRPIRLHRHQVEAIEAARTGENYILTTGTGSGKSLTYIIPIVDHVLRHGSGRGIQAVIVYPMNALANSQVGELEKFLCRGNRTKRARSPSAATPCLRPLTRLPLWEARSDGYHDGSTACRIGLHTACVCAFRGLPASCFALPWRAAKVVRPGCRGEALLCRYADDWVCAFRYRDDADRFSWVLPERLAKFNLELAPEKTRTLRFSRFHPSRTRRFTFLGFEFYWMPDREGVVRVKRRTAPKKLQAACRRVKTWIREHGHLPGREFLAGLNRRLRGHYNYYGVRGNSAALYRFFAWAIRCAFKWLNRRGGKRRSFSWATFVQALERLGVERPRITEVRRRRVFA